MSAPPPMVSAAFGFETDVVVHRLGGGWTNDTFVLGPRSDVSGESGGRTDGSAAGVPIVVQRLSHRAFREPLRVMENLVRVCGHLDWNQPRSEPQRWYRSLVPTVAGKPFVLDDDGFVWRGFVYLEGRTPVGAVSAEAAASIAGIYGRFLVALDDFDGPDLDVVVADFHDLAHVVGVFDQLWQERTGDPRRVELEPLRRRIDQVADGILRHGRDRGIADVARRVVHNDTKFSNVLLDRSGHQATAVLDLDLVMAGHAHTDFGDLVRSASRHRTHDPSAKLDLDWLGLVAAGYWRHAGAVIDRDERDMLSAGPAQISFELALRYFADHLRDEPVLRLAPPRTALGRGIENLELAEQLVERRADVDRVVAAATGTADIEPFA